MIELSTSLAPIIAGAETNYGQVALGHHEDGTPLAAVHVGRKNGAGSTTTVHVIADADFAEDLAHALQTAADHLRQEAPTADDEETPGADG